MKPNKIILTLLITFVLFNVSNAQNIEKLIDSLNNYIIKKHIPGAMISIVKSDTILFSGGIGYADLDKNEKATAEHLFRQGSISKSFTALGLVDLVAKGKLDLNTSIRKIDPTIPFSNEWENVSPVTIAHLLEHTSGFDEFHLKAIYNTTDAIEPPTIKMINAHKDSYISRWKPGTYRAYSNAAYILAGHILEKVSNQPYHQYVKNNILLPLEMTKSNYYFNKPTNFKTAQGYNFNGVNHDKANFTRIQGGPAGSFCSNANEMSKFLQFMLTKKANKIDSTLFTDKVFERIEKSETNSAAKNGLPFGYGLGNYSIWKNGYTFHGHGGGIEGFASRYLYSREADIGVAVAINREGNANALADEILNLVLGEQKKAIDRKMVQIPTELKEKYEGFYKFSSPRHQLFSFSDTMLAGLIIDFEDDKVITKSILGRERDTLYYAGNNQFYKNNEGVPSTLFLETENGKPAFWINQSITIKESRAKRLIVNFAVWISFLLPIIFILVVLIKFIIRLFSKKQKSLKYLLMPFFASLSYVLMIVGFAVVMNDRETAGNANFGSILLYVSSITLVVFSVFSTFKYFKLHQKRSFKIYYMFTTLSLIILSVFFWYYGFIGLKLWKY